MIFFYPNLYFSHKILKTIKMPTYQKIEIYWICCNKHPNIIQTDIDLDFIDFSDVREYIENLQNNPDFTRDNPCNQCGEYGEMYDIEYEFIE